MIGVRSALVQSQTKNVGMGSRMHDLFGVLLIILRILSSFIVQR